MTKLYPLLNEAAFADVKADATRYKNFAFIRAKVRCIVGKIDRASCISGKEMRESAACVLQLTSSQSRKWVSQPPASSFVK